MRVRETVNATANETVKRLKNKTVVDTVIENETVIGAK